MKAYKGLSALLTCRGLQYKVGEKMVHEGDVSMCHSGLHACTNPIDVLKYYPASEENRYFEVECGGTITSGDNDSKIVCTELTLTAELSIPALVGIGAEMIFEKVEKEEAEEFSRGDHSTAATSGTRSTAATSGNESNAATSGYYSTAATRGDYSTAATSGPRSTAATSGDRSTAATSGDRSTAATSGDRSIAATSGYSSTAATSGDCSTAATSGPRSTAEALGKDSIAVANGRNSRARGALGCYIVLTEYDNNGLVCAKMCKVDGKRYKAGVYYTLKGDDVVEVG